MRRIFTHHILPIILLTTMILMGLPVRGQDTQPEPPVTPADEQTRQTPPTEAEAAVPEGETLLLALRPVVDKQYVVRSTSKYKTTHQYADNTILTQQEAVADWIFRVMKFDEETGLSTISVTLDNLKVTQMTGDKVLRYDSQAGTGPESEQSPAALGFSALAGANFEVVLDAGGRVRDLRGADALVQRSLQNLNAPDTPVRQEVQKQLERFFGPAALADVVESLLAVLPPVPDGQALPEPVSRGASWQVPAAVAGFLTRDAQLTVALENPDAGIEAVRLGISGEIQSPENPANFQVGGATVQMLLSGTVSGGADVHRQTGWATRNVQRINLQGTVKAVENTYDLTQPEWKVTIEGSVAHELIAQ